jgi:hypothetical protein
MAHAARSGKEKKEDRQRDPELSSNWGTICTLLKLWQPTAR